MNLSRLTRALAGGQLVRAWLVVRSKLQAGAAQAVAALLGLLAMVFLALGGYASLADTLPAWQAGALIAGMLLLAALLLRAWGRWRAREVLASAEGAAGPPGGKARAPSSHGRRVSGSDGRRAEETYLAELGLRAGEELARQGVRATDLALVAFLAGLAVSAGRTESRRGDDQR